MPFARSVRTASASDTRIDRLFRPRERFARRVRRKPDALGCETLEDRVVPAGMPSFAVGAAAGPGGGPHRPKFLAG